MLPELLYYDQVNWINLDPTRTCTFSTYESVFVEMYSTSLQASYQTYNRNGAKCILNTSPAQLYTNQSWLYSNFVLESDPTVCGFFITLTNNSPNQEGMFQIIRTSALYIKTSIVAMAALYISVNL